MIYFVGAGPGAVDLISVKGAELLKKADLIIYAGSLVNPEIITTYAKKNCEILNSASMTLEEISQKMIDAHKKNLLTVRLHSGDSSIFGAINEQMNFLREKNIDFEIVPGISSFCAASASLKVEYTIPEITQTLIITRCEGKTPVPEDEKLSLLAKHKSSIAVFLSTGMIEKVCEEIISGGYEPETPAALVYKASLPDEKIILATLKTLPELVLKSGITKTGIILIGEFLNGKKILKESKLYDKKFSHEFRKSK